jgi:hypothetical protein
MTSGDQVQIQALSQRILMKCAHRFGGAAALARHLEVSQDTLADWLNGIGVPPVDLILRAVTPLISDPGSPASLQTPLARRSI